MGWSIVLDWALGVLSDRFIFTYKGDLIMTEFEVLQEIKVLLGHGVGLLFILVCIKVGNMLGELYNKYR